MFFERVNKFRRTLAFRLTLLYTAVFALSSFIAFLTVYEVMISRIHARTDKILGSEMKEVSSMLASKGIETVKKEIVDEAESIGTNDVFFRLLSLEGDEIASSNLDSWKGIGISRIA